MGVAELADFTPQDGSTMVEVHAQRIAGEFRAEAGATKNGAVRKTMQSRGSELDVLLRYFQHGSRLEARHGARNLFEQLPDQIGLTSLRLRRFAGRGGRIPRRTGDDLIPALLRPPYFHGAGFTG